MDIGIPIRDLGEVDITALREAVLTQPQEVWDENDHRQESYHVHRFTESIVLLFCDKTWPNPTVTQEAGWPYLADVAVPIMHELIERHYPKDGVVLRCIAAKLKPGGHITPHKDSLRSFHHGHRIHVPLQTNSRVRFTLEGRPYPMEVGKAYEINNQMQHSVLNRGKEDRIHMIFDYAPGVAADN